MSIEDQEAEDLADDELPGEDQDLDEDGDEGEELSEGARDLAARMAAEDPAEVARMQREDRRRQARTDPLVAAELEEQAAARRPPAPTPAPARRDYDTIRFRYSRMRGRP